MHTKGKLNTYVPSLEVKLAVVKANARARGRAEAAIIEEQVKAAEKALIETRQELHNKFCLDCWNGFQRECSQQELEGMLIEARKELGYDDK